jgi:hypothetical protein
MTTTPPPATRTSSQRKDWWVRATILGLGTLIVIAMAYGSGMRATARKVKAKDAVLGETRSRLSALQVRSDAQAAAINRLEARRHLHLALLALDERNFGIAQQHVETAAARLQAAADSQRSGDAAALSSDIKNTQLLAAGGDLGAQRERVLTFARRLDALLPAEGQIAP